jgi:hypothetical protein
MYDIKCEPGLKPDRLLISLSGSVGADPNNWHRELIQAVTIQTIGSMGRERAAGAAGRRLPLMSRRLPDPFGPWEPCLP